MQKRFLILFAVISAGALGIWAYQVYSARYPSTEDAYVAADVVRVAPRVSGRIAGVNVANHQHVDKGAVLFTIDQAPFRFALRQAEAQLDLATREVSQAQAAVASAAAEEHNRQVLLDNARSKLQRAQRLAKKDYISNESVTDAEADYKSAAANLQVAQAKLEEARRQLGKPGDDNDRVVEAKASLDQSQWQLDNTTVMAACNGQVSELNLQPGNVVNAVATTGWMPILRRRNSNAYVRARRSIFASTCTRITRFTASSKTSVRQRDRCFPCCRRKMPTATGSRSSSEFRYGFASITRTRNSRCSSAPVLLSRSIPRQLPMQGGWRRMRQS